MHITSLLGGSRVFAGRIFISDRMAVLGDDEILFVLLHEEAHLTLPQNIRPYLAPALPITLFHAVATLHWAWWNGSLVVYQASALLMLSYLLLLLSVLVFKKQLLAEDELNADRFAAQRMRSFKGVDPLPVAINVLTHRGGGTMTSGPLLRVKRTFDIHPPLSERLEAVTEGSGSTLDSSCHH